VTDYAGNAATRQKAAQRSIEAGITGSTSRLAGRGAFRRQCTGLGVVMSVTNPTEQFEKTFRLVCRLDDADIDYVRDTAEWIRRCVGRVLAVNPSATANDVTPIVVDMSSRGRWRLMRPETVGEQLALPVPPAPAE
jgi:hypothetical protein